ncbi:hypothetical protein Q8A67_014940 [Cirrhinus molitorella]|uniref:Uncharacterized protein n=1 Tax=Cirrhinus molitorella TaxID=172907 RepID=A0AA88PRF4_9TELE|nr:hypothetical protein Q8A67_014940 [Cirrhinus molitorella]
MIFNQASAGRMPSAGSLEFHKSTQSPEELNGDGSNARSGLNLKNGRPRLLIRGGPTRRDHVLPPVVTPGPPDPQALKSSPVVQPLHVHGLLPAQLPVGEEAVYHLCLSLPGGVVSHLLQLLGKLLSVSLPRFSTAGLSTRPQHCGHLDSVFAHRQLRTVNTRAAGNAGKFRFFVPTSTTALRCNP